MGNLHTSVCMITKSAYFKNQINLLWHIWICVKGSMRRAPNRPLFLKAMSGGVGDHYVHIKCNDKLQAA